MKGCDLVIGVTALALAIAAQIEEDEDLSLVAAVLTQLGDTLATLAALRAKCAVEEAAQEAAKQEEKKAEEAPAEKET